MSTRVLLVEPGGPTRARLQQAARAVAHVESRPDFSSARTCLGVTSFDFLVANLRLGAHNGLHLVYLAAAHWISARSIVYSDLPDDLGLARDAQRAGAFYEAGECIPVTLTAYLRGALPRHDRRDPARRDRRAIFRGGRRCWDLHIAGLVY